MPQYPLPPWRPDDEVLPWMRRKSRIGVDNPRFAHLAVIAPSLDGQTIEVLRGDPPANATASRHERQPHEWERAEDGPFYARHHLLTNKDWAGRPFFVAVNRLGRILFTPRPRCPQEQRVILDDLEHAAFANSEPLATVDADDLLGPFPQVFLAFAEPLVWEPVRKPTPTGTGGVVEH